MRGSISVRGLGKVFRRQVGDRPNTFKELVLHGWKRSHVERFWGLREITFTVQPGRSVGVVGKNGAGKSTLLRLIGNVGKPDEGEVSINGRIGALLDLGAGLTDDLTGRENVFVAGVVAGMLRAEIQERFDSIVRFAELEDFIDNPIRTYSTGMRMRLAFSVAVHIDPDVLLIDEALAVGDVSFQRKCLARISEIKASGCTIFLVSHDASQIRALCDEVIYLRQGRLVAHGATDETLALYESSALPEAVQVDGASQASIPLAGGKSLEMDVNRFGSLEAVISRVTLRNAHGNASSTILSGGALSVELELGSKRPVRGALASVTIHLPDGTAIFDSNTEIGGVDLDELGQDTTVVLSVDRLDLAAGEYSISVGLYAAHWEYAYDYHSEAYSVTVIGLGSGKGFLDPPLKWSAERGTSAEPRAIAAQQSDRAGKPPA